MQQALHADLYSDISQLVGTLQVHSVIGSPVQRTCDPHPHRVLLVCCEAHKVEAVTDRELAMERRTHVLYSQMLNTEFS